MNIATHFTPGSSLAGGALIGLSAGPFILLNGKIAGISGLIAGVLSGHGEGRTEKLLFIAGLIASPFIWPTSRSIERRLVLGSVSAGLNQYSPAPMLQS